MTSPTIETISHEEFRLIQDNQCPLPPRKYSYLNDKNERCSIKTTAWFYKDHFWIQEEQSRKIYPVILKPKELNKFKKRMSQMRNVDKYISAFGLTSSVQVYKILTQAMDLDALSPKTQGAFRRRTSGRITQAQLYAKKFNPTWWNRLSFFVVIGRAALNAYFIGYNFWTIDTVPVNFYYFVLVIVAIEAVLFLISLLRTLYNVYSLLKRVCQGSTTHFQVKNIPENLRQLGSLSVMRYLPNGESVVMFKKRGKEWISEKKASYKFEVGNAQKFKYLVILRWIILSILDVIGPFVAVFSLLFKMAQLNFQFDALWQWRWFEIVGYFAFVNQVAGIRKVRKIEIDALEHFIFSGSDIKLSVEENLLLDAWYNYTIVSCVANICDEFKYPVFDSIIFWYNLNVRRIQLLFKDHKGFEGKQFVKQKIDFKEYDDEIQKQMQQQLSDEAGMMQESNTNSALVDEEEKGQTNIMAVAVSVGSDNEDDEEEMP